jgi:tRNA(fMet)-specific endonuclease VapC
MLIHQLDANICIGLINGDKQLATRLRLLQGDSIAVCAIVRAELYYGARKSDRIEENLMAHANFVQPYRTLPFDELAAQHYGQIRAELANQGKLIGGNDLMIAAIARANDCVLVTRNIREFVRVSGLRTEVW